MIGSIVITIDPDHPDYHAFLRLLTAPVSGSAGHVTIEQSADGIWSLKLAIVTPRPSSLHYKCSSVQIGIENASISGALMVCASVERPGSGGSAGTSYSSGKSK